MKRIVQKEAYICDCCGEEFEEKNYVRGSLYGYRDGESIVTFEPKVFGDYCKSCMELIQENWNKFGAESVCHDRYDDEYENTLKDEIYEVKQLIK